MKGKLAEPLKSSLIGGTICGIISALLSYAILPFPENLTDHVVGTSVGGFLCGFFAVLLHIIVHALRDKQE
jgi:hypothetical protein